MAFRLQVNFQCTANPRDCLGVEKQWNMDLLQHWAITTEYYIADSPTVLKKDHVSLVPYDSEWLLLAQTEIDKIKSVFPTDAIVDIQHVGSTAIIGLSPKPILDV